MLVQKSDREAAAPGGVGLDKFESVGEPAGAGVDKPELAGSTGDDEAPGPAAEFVDNPGAEFTFAWLPFVDEFGFADLFEASVEFEFDVGEFLLVPLPAVDELALAAFDFASPDEAVELSRDDEFRLLPAGVSPRLFVPAPRLFAAEDGARFVPELAGRMLPLVSDH